MFIYTREKAQREKTVRQYWLKPSWTLINAGSTNHYGIVFIKLQKMYIVILAAKNASVSVCEKLYHVLRIFGAANLSILERRFNIRTIKTIK